MSLNVVNVSTNNTLKRSKNNHTNWQRNSLPVSKSIKMNSKSIHCKRMLLKIIISRSIMPIKDSKLRPSLSISSSSRSYSRPTAWWEIRIMIIQEKQNIKFSLNAKLRLLWSFRWLRTSLRKSFQLIWTSNSFCPPRKSSLSTTRIHKRKYKSQLNLMKIKTKTYKA